MQPVPLRKTGLDVLGDRPWGTHFCVFYETNDDLVEMLIPYFKAGIENHEFCFWVLAEHLTEDDARSALNRALPRPDRHLVEKNIEFLRSEECYLKGGIFNLERVTAEWGDRLARALAAGYEGIRVSGYAGWLQTREWPDFWKYEGSLNKSIIDLPMIVLCTYPLTGSSGSDILDVAHTHQCAVSRRGGNWEVIETAALKEAKEEIERLKEELEQRVIERTRELSLAQGELARVERLTTMGRLAASITHEIAQPISAMVTNADSCLRWLNSPVPDLDEARETVRALVKDGNRAADVFRSIRSLVQKAEPRMDPLDINEVIGDVLALARGEIQTQDVLVRADLTATLPRLRGDRVQLQQVLLNLVTNAIQAMAGVKDRPRILTIRSQIHERDDILVEVEDSGIGLDLNSIDQIFESMFTTKPNGMGMGLSISRSIVAAHGGRLWASPGDSLGAIFRIVLPTDASGNGIVGQASG
jgi:C4-dicarboxylate-specific signal transduction histidine kinase